MDIGHIKPLGMADLVTPFLFVTGANRLVLAADDRNLLSPRVLFDAQISGREMGLTVTELNDGMGL